MRKEVEETEYSYSDKSSYINVLQHLVPNIIADKLLKEKRHSDLIFMLKFILFEFPLNEITRI